ncbi:hypothetical protein GCM10027569_87350 [Flindersiella endophytica]
MILRALGDGFPLGPYLLTRDVWDGLFGAAEPVGSLFRHAYSSEEPEARAPPLSLPCCRRACFLRFCRREIASDSAAARAVRIRNVNR